MIVRGSPAYQLDILGATESRVPSRHQERGDGSDLVPPTRKAPGGLPFAGIQVLSALAVGGWREGLLAGAPLHHPPLLALFQSILVTGWTAGPGWGRGTVGFDCLGHQVERVWVDSALHSFLVQIHALPPFVTPVETILADTVTVRPVFG